LSNGNREMTWVSWLIIVGVMAITSRSRIVEYFQLRSRLRLYRRQVDAWQITPQMELEVTLDPPSINGLKFGDSVEDAGRFGRPARVTLLTPKLVSLLFPQQGLVLEFEEDRLLNIGILILPEQDSPPLKDVAAANAMLVVETRIPLTSQIPAERLVQILGEPTEDDEDEFERVLTQSIGTVIVESEFTREGELKRFNLFV